MKPEEKAEIVLWDWLKTKSECIQEVYFNRINKLDAPVFTTKGINKKPDLIIKFDRGYGIEYAAVEVKSSEQSKNIHDARKIIDYYERYVKGKTKYYINEVEIKLSHFLVATENSKYGYLFLGEKQTISNIDSGDDWRKTNAKYKIEPMREYSLTSSFVRGLWANFRFFREEYIFMDKPSIGILMSDFANGDCTPHLFIMNFNNHLKSKRWGARFWKL